MASRDHKDCEESNYMHFGWYDIEYRMIQGSHHGTIYLLDFLIAHSDPIAIYTYAHAFKQVIGILGNHLYGVYR